MNRNEITESIVNYIFQRRAVDSDEIIAYSNWSQLSGIHLRDPKDAIWALDFMKKILNFEPNYLKAFC